ncbi:hypothetical protein ACHAWF_016172 [Thalassiosira exigua]
MNTIRPQKLGRIQFLMLTVHVVVWACVWQTARAVQARTHNQATIPSRSLNPPISSRGTASGGIGLELDPGAVEGNANTSHGSECKQGMASRALEKALRTRAGSTSQSTSVTTKKYTAAAESAMKTMRSLASGSRRPIPPNLLSESALMDKETNAIYWQGGADIISTSLTKPYLTQRGFLHVKATILTAALWLWVWGKLSRYLASRYFESGGTVQDHKLLFSLPLISPEKAPPILRKIASFISPVVQFFLLLFHCLLYLRLPQYSPKVIATTIILYLLEAYSCSTRRYLSHALDAPAEVESYLEQIRRVEPAVTWKVRCFHYEDREFWKNIQNCTGAWKIWTNWMRKSVEDGGDADEGGKARDQIGAAPSNSGSKNGAETVSDSPPLWLARKVITHQAVGTYKFGSWEDCTLASLWKRSQSFSSTSQEAPAPFSKLTLSKLLVLKDKATRENYFAQQAAFVMQEGRKDVHAEFATSISVPGFRPKLLAVHPVRRASNVSAALFSQHVYVLFTLLGLSLPFRIWFAKHCEEIRVTVVKETSSAEIPKDAEVPPEVKASWFRGKWGRSSSSSPMDMDSKRAQELFRQNMQSYSLYDDESTAKQQTAASSVPEAANPKDVESVDDDALVSDPNEGSEETGSKRDSTLHEDTGTPSDTNHIDPLSNDTIQTNILSNTGLSEE